MNKYIDVCVYIIVDENRDMYTYEYEEREADKMSIKRSFTRNITKGDSKNEGSDKAKSMTEKKSGGGSPLRGIRVKRTQQNEEKESEQLQAASKEIEENVEEIPKRQNDLSDIFKLQKKRADIRVTTYIEADLYDVVTRLKEEGIIVKKLFNESLREFLTRHNQI